MRKLSGRRPAVRGGFVFLFSPFVEGMGVGAEGIGREPGSWAARNGQLLWRDVISMTFYETGLRLGFVFQQIATRLYFQPVGHHSA